MQRHGSGKHQAVVEGVNWITLLWTEGDRQVLGAYRLDDRAGDGLTKHDHFAVLLKTARQRWFVPECVIFDSGYGSLANVKLINGWGWNWLTRLKANRLVNPNRYGWRAVTRVETDANGTLVPLTGDGLIRWFQLVAQDGDIEGWASNALQMSPLTRRWAGSAWPIAHYHRGIKPFCGVERTHVRAAGAQRNHISLCWRAFLRLEWHCYHAGISGFEAKTAIIRPAVRAHLANPLYRLPATA